MQHRPPNPAGEAPAGAELSELQAELGELLERMTGPRSELELIRLLPRAKALYEQLHPETRHGGPRPQRDTSGAKPAAAPSFVQHVAKALGMAPRTVYRRLTAAEQRRELDANAARASLGTALAPTRANARGG